MRAMVERRRILKTLGLAGLGLLLEKSSPPISAQPLIEPNFAFEEVPASSTGITWEHVSGASLILRILGP